MEDGASGGYHSKVSIQTIVWVGQPWLMAKTLTNERWQYNAQARTIWLTKDESNLGWVYIISSLPFKQTDSENWL